MESEMLENEATLTQEPSERDRSLELSRESEKSPIAVPGFTIFHCLGEGAYGAVWLAREDNTGKQVAIKFYTHRRGLDWSLLNREVEKLAVLYTSRSIVRLLGVGWDSDPPYYVMEYLENGSLASLVADGPLPPNEAVRIAKSVLKALVHAHGSGILHCDLKPANVLLDADYEPRICDFGQSRMSDEQNPALGTLFYMAPEQADLKAIPDARWDVYALGALMYHMLCGVAPFRTEENESLIRSGDKLDERLAIYRRILKQNPKPNQHRKASRVDERLADIVDRCLKIDPNKRFPNAQAVLESLELRDRLRARRPLLTLGVVGPIFLLLAMMFGLRMALHTTVEQTQATITERAIESDVLPTRILARSLKRDLDDRKAELVQIAADMTLNIGHKDLLDADIVSLPDVMRASIGKKTWEERAHLFKGLKDAKLASEKQRMELEKPAELSWFVNDRSGKQLWRHPHSDNTIDRDWSHRDYFTGLGRDLPRADEETPPEEQEIPSEEKTSAITPIDEPYVSVAFRSGETKQLMVAISVPIWDEQHTEVVGILARTTHLGHLLDDYGEVIRGRAEGDDIQRVVALVDGHDGSLLSHPWMSEAPGKMADLDDAEFYKATVDSDDMDTIQEMIRHRDGNGDADETQDYTFDYHDPVRLLDEEAVAYSGTWLAAFALVEGTKWVAVVQEKSEATLKPIRDLETKAGSWTTRALLASLALMAVLWYFVWRALNEKRTRIWKGKRVLLQTLESGSTTTDT